MLFINQNCKVNSYFLGSCKACLLAPSFISHLSVSAGPEVNVQKQDHNNSSLNTELESNVFSNDVCNIECSDSGIACITNYNNINIFLQQFC